MESLEDDCMFTLTYKNRKVFVLDWDRNRHGYFWGTYEFVYEGIGHDLEDKLLDILENKLPNFNAIGQSKDSIDILGLSMNCKNIQIFACTSTKQ